MRQQEYFMVNWLLKKLSKLQKNVYGKGLGTNLPELKVKSKELKKE